MPPPSLLRGSGVGMPPGQHAHPGAGHMGMPPQHAHVHAHAGPSGSAGGGGGGGGLLPSYVQGGRSGGLASKTPSFFAGGVPDAGALGMRLAGGMLSAGDPSGAAYSLRSAAEPFMPPPYGSSAHGVSVAGGSSGAPGSQSLLFGAPSAMSGFSLLSGAAGAPPGVMSFGGPGGLMDVQQHVRNMGLAPPSHVFGHMGGAQGPSEADDVEADEGMNHLVSSLLE